MQSPSPARDAAAAPAPVREWWWIFDPRCSLRARASLIFGGGAVLFALALSWFAGGLFRRHLEHQLGSSLETLAFQVSDKLDRTLFERQRELQLTASLAPFRQAGTPAEERRRLLEALQLATPAFAWLGQAGPDGRISTATHGLFEGRPVAERAWFREARVVPYAGDWHAYPELAREIPYAPNELPGFVDLAVPLSSESGQFLGVLAGHVRWGWARDVQLSVVPESARQERLGVTIYDASGEVLLDSGGSGWSEPPDAPAIPENRRFRGTLLENATGGTRYVTGYVRTRGFEEYPGLNWLVTVRQPVDYAFAPVDELQRAIFGGGLLFAMSFVVLSWIFGGRIAWQMRRITSTAERIRSGDILAAMPRPRDDSEFARMSRAVGDMVDELRHEPERFAEAKNEPGKPQEKFR